MNLDDLRVQWAAYDRKLDTLLRFNAQAAREALRTAARTRVRWVTAFTAADLLVGACATVFLVTFTARHLQTPRLALDSAILLAALVPFFGARVWQLTLLARLDYGAPVVVLQKGIETLRMMRVRQVLWALAVGIAIWPLAAIVAVEVLFGFDASGVGIAFLAANAAVGLVVGLVLMRFRGNPRLQKELAGVTLESARAKLAELARFEREVDDEA
jgi:hypothetical protein